MDKNRRKELVEQYKQIKIYMGIFQIKNEKNGKIYIGTCSNLKNRWLTLRGQLEIGRFANAELQKEWKQQGPEVFDYEVLEQKEVKPETDVKWELKQMEKMWLVKLQPYDEKGYNKRKEEQ
ncbi:GIY-YIG nuclease family protein [Clostridium aminobutyricum]|uniref:GIY-YIG nuclease family protein n=1 Tax=Clostridium aminobutyricum TaxID=33953 RepID=A0A939D6Q5_CLOAM|nr:GIY-YIG nuclease family protein [Clostridium aminobutyricum]MBN7772117.1 GIY-YIG nuclease family protein [Clostridium aminobutyricum]